MSSYRVFVLRRSFRHGLPATAMDNLYQLLPLVILLTIVGWWLKLVRRRELACAEVRRQCERHGFQWLDEMVSLRGLQLRKVGGRYQLEHCYYFECSASGDDRQAGRLWMIGSACTGLSLPWLHADVSKQGHP